MTLMMKLEWSKVASSSRQRIQACLSVIFQSLLAAKAKVWLLPKARSNTSLSSFFEKLVTSLGSVLKADALSTSSPLPSCPSLPLPKRKSALSLVMIPVCPPPQITLVIY